MQPVYKHWYQLVGDQQTADTSVLNRIVQKLESTECCLYRHVCNMWFVGATSAIVWFMCGQSCRMPVACMS
jgi:hypothetical protein